MLEQQLQQRDIGTGRLFGSVQVTFLKPHLSGAPAAFATFVSDEEAWSQLKHATKDIADTNCTPRFLKM